MEPEDNRSPSAAWRRSEPLEASGVCMAEGTRVFTGRALFFTWDGYVDATRYCSRGREEPEVRDPGDQLLAREIRDLGQQITWENIGDPVEKGEQVVPWIRDIIHELIDDPKSFGYCDTAGYIPTREFLAHHVNVREGGVQITPDDLLFFNGVGDAVAKVYGFLKREARVLGPSPAYSTHSSAEAAHSGYDKHMTYRLDPQNGWLPDVDDIRKRVKYNDSIAGILLLSPDNPTGAVFPKDVLDEIVKIAQEYDLFIIADEIYAHIVYEGQLAAAHEPVDPRRAGAVDARHQQGIPVAGLALRLARNPEQNRTSRTCSTASLLAAKRLEVCSTTLPQMSIPRVFGDARYPEHLKTRAAMFAARADEVQAAFAGCAPVIVNRPGGAFYQTVMFKPGILNDTQTLKVENAAVRTRIEALTKNVTPDKRFVYYLMAATGIVVVPLTGFQCDHPGFRFTLLETDPVKRAWILKTLRESIEAYVAS